MKFQEYTNNAGTLLAASPETVASNITGALHGNDAPRIQVARAPAGQFVVVWETNSISGSGTDTYTTHAQLYSASGKATGKSLVVGSDAFVMSVAMNNNGFDVLYGAHAGGKRYFNGGWTMTEQRYNSAGSALGSAVSVTSVGIPEHLAGSIAMDGNSDSVVVWNYETSNPSTGQPLFTIEAQPLNSSGAPTTSVIAVSGSASNAVGGGTVAMDPTTGEFVVPWTQTVPVPTGRAADDLYANQYQLNGTLVQQVSVATPTYASVVETNGTTYYYPTAGDVGDTTGVATLPGGAFDLSWTNVYETMTPASTPSGYTATAYTNINVSTYNADGTANQSFAVTNDGTSSGSTVALDGNNDLFVIWQDSGNIDGQFYLDPPAPAPTVNASTASSPSGTATPSGSTAAATDAAFAAYAYPDDDTLA